MKNGYHVRWIPMFSVASGHFTWKSELFMVNLYRKSIPVLMFTFLFSLVMALHLDKLKSESFQVVLCKPEWLLAKTFSCNLSLVAIPKQIEIDVFPGRYRWYSPHNCRMVPPSDVCWFITFYNPHEYYSYIANYIFQLNAIERGAHPVHVSKCSIDFGVALNQSNSFAQHWSIKGFWHHSCCSLGLPVS